MNGTRQARWLLPNEPATVTTARHRASAQLSTWGLDVEHQAHQAVELIISELVTNAVQYSGGPSVTVGLQTRDDQITIEVWDNNTSPHTDTRAAGQGRGRGLALVTILATDWGTHPSQGGKSVWATLPLSYRQRPPRRIDRLSRRPDPASSSHQDSPGQCHASRIHEGGTPRRKWWKRR